MKPIIRLAEEGDKIEILTLLNDVFLQQQRSSTTRGDRYWNWKFLDSPFGRSVLTVAEANDRIVGVDNLWPWEFRVRGSVYKAYQPCDSVVRPEARGAGVFRNMRLFGLDLVKDTHPAFLFNFPNSQSITTNLSLGWYSLGKVRWIVKVLRPLNLIKGMRSVEKAGAVRLPESYNLDLQFLQSLSAKYQATDEIIRPNRREGFFEWRYLNHPGRYYGMTSIEKGGSSIAGIFTVNQRQVYREMFIVDFVGDRKLLPELLKAVIGHCKMLGVSIMAFMDNIDHCYSRLWTSGFVSYRSKNFVVLPLESDIKFLVREFGSWNMNACMHDSI